MLAASTTPPGDLAGHLVEPKWDGVRVIVTVDDGRVRATSRNGRDVTSHYPELAGLGAALGGRAAVLDSEVVAFDAAGRPSFQLLQRRMHVRAPTPELVAAVPVVAMFFDLLWLDGELLTDLPQRERRARLEALGVEGPAWHTTPLVPAAPVDELLRACAEIGMEGYVVKRADARYSPGRRSAAWVKLKCVERRELVVGGWIGGRRGRAGSIGSLAVGIHGLDRAAGAGTGRLHYLGQVGSGLTEDWIRQLGAVCARLATDESPFAEQLVNVRFLRPVLVAEVAYRQVTEGATLRQPSLLGFRTDVDPASIVADEALQDALDARPPGLRIEVRTGPAAAQTW